jgi:hypothetical protein
MNFIELLMFVLLSGILLALGRFLAGMWGPVGWLIGVVPVGMFWAWVLFCFLRCALSSVLRKASISPAERKHSD